MVLKFKLNLNLLDDLTTQSLLSPYLQCSYPVVLWWGLRNCIFDIIPSSTDSAGLETPTLKTTNLDIWFLVICMEKSEWALGNDSCWKQFPITLQDTTFL